MRASPSRRPPFPAQALPNLTSVPGKPRCRGAWLQATSLCPSTACVSETALKGSGLGPPRRASPGGRGRPRWQRSPCCRPRRRAQGGMPLWGRRPPAPGRAGLGCPRSACRASGAPPRSGRGLQVPPGRERQPPGRGVHLPPHLRRRWTRLSPHSPRRLVPTAWRRAARRLPTQMSFGGISTFLSLLQGCRLLRSGSGRAQAPCPSSCTGHRQSPTSLPEKPASPLFLGQRARAWSGGARAPRGRLPGPRALSD